MPFVNCFKYQGQSKYLRLVKCCLIVAVYTPYTSVKIEEFKGLIVITFTRRYREIGGESLERCLFKTSVPVILQ